jgi:Tol biopolymer transport system component
LRKKTPLLWQWIVPLALVSMGNSQSASPVQLLSARVPSVVQPAGGNGNSVAPVVSADGRFVLFSSSANNLVAGDNSQLGLDVFLHDSLSNTTVIVSVRTNGAGGGNGNSLFGGVSTNGRYVVFESDASDLVAGDTNGFGDIFVRDLVAGTTELISVSTNGGPADGASSQAVMTADGRYVAFVSAASNLVLDDTNRVPDVFVRDRLAQSTVVASVGASSNFLAFMSTPAISPDGRYVAFTSNARGLAPGIPAGPIGEVYLRDLIGGTTRWVSTNGATILSNAWNLLNVPSSHPSLSDDGRFVAFKTGSTNGAGLAVILQYDALNDLTTVVATNGFPAFAFTDDIFGPEMSPDGRFVAYAARSLTNQNYADLYLWDSQTATNIPVSVDQTGVLSTNAISHTPALSPDGRFVVFLSNATNLVANTIANGFHIYLRDVVSGTNQLVDVDTNGIGSTDIEGTVATVNADGRFVAFSSPDGSFVGLDNNNAYDVFLRDTVAGSTELMSRRDAGVIPQTGNGLSSSTALSLSADGRWAVFSSAASDLVLDDTNEAADVFVRDLLAGTNALVSVGTNGVPALGGFSSGAVISADGRFVVFVSAATNLVSAPTFGSPFSRCANIYRRDLFAQTNVMVSVSGASAGNGDASAPVVSADGRYVAFMSRSGNLGGPPGTFRRDVNGGTTMSMPSSSVSATILPSMSLNGNYVAYLSGTTARVWDAVFLTNVYTSPSLVTSMALSPTGNQLMFQTNGRISVVDLVTKSNLVTFDSRPLIQSSAQWSTNGRFFTFVTASNAVAGDSNGTNDVYLYDLLGSTLTLVSVDSNLLASANGPSDSPTISGDGRFVAYRSFATNIVAGITNPPPNIFLFDRFSGSNTLLSSAQTISSWTTWASKPAISGNGLSVTFESWAPGLAQPDLNRGRDVFGGLVDAAIDSDNDGIPDAWMMQHFGHPLGQANDLSRAQDDADGDGMNNLQEYLAGTDPNDAASVLKIDITYSVGANSVVLKWPAAAARVYQVQFKDNLADPVWLDLPGSVSVIGNQAQLTAPVTSPGRYYRVTAN